jgi:lysozyme family protein
MVNAFDIATRYLYVEEGGDKEANDPRDRGGRTRFGISARAHPDVNLDTLTWPLALKIYREYYWDFIKGDSLPIGVAIVLFDGAVNQGRERAAMWLQKAVLAQIDALVGPSTLKRLSMCDPIDVIEKVAASRMLAYHDDAQRRKNSSFINNWSHRLMRTTARAVLHQIREA